MAPGRRLEFFFDCSSPWTYLAFHRIEDLAAETGAELLWRPILVGGVFNVVNREIYEQRSKLLGSASPRARYYDKDLADWARSYGLALSRPPIFPVNSVKAMRGCFVAEEAGCLPAWSRSVFEAYWGDHLDISQDDVLSEIARRVGLDAEPLLERVRGEPLRARLRANTDELVERGGFGSPTMFVDGDDMYFGNDRLPLVREALSR